MISSCICQGIGSWAVWNVPAYYFDRSDKGFDKPSEDLNKGSGDRQELKESMDRRQQDLPERLRILAETKKDDTACERLWSASM